VADDVADQDFLGTGWTFPPTFNRHNASIMMSSDVRNIKQSLWVLFSTSLGERIMLATYGTNLRSKVFDSLTETLANDIRSIILKAILDWEPRIDVIQITVQEVSPLEGRLAISIDFVVRRTNVRSNLVYPFYLNEATFAVPPP
jgi:phage baseplate assembly protein W